MTFEKLGLISPILKSLHTEGYETPTPIQAQAIPPILENRDIMGCAQTGTGKTAAFTLPILQKIAAMKEANPTSKKIKALIVTPTRELALQIGDCIRAYGRNLPVKHTVVFGGVGQQAQVDALTRGVDILVATPGRLLDLYDQGYIKLDEIKLFVLDEADRMLDMGFVHDVKKILRLIPTRRQSLFFSATMPPSIMQLAGTILVDPVTVFITPVSSTAETIQQKLYYVDQGNKIPLLIDILEENNIQTALVFTRTKHGADKLVKHLVKVNITAQAIHGNKSQNHRVASLNNFKNGSIRVLVATDIAARGIDIDDLAFVVNFEIPNVPETYVHRIGRTGRAGAQGAAVSFVDREEVPFILDIQKLIKMFIPEVKDHAYLPSQVMVDLDKVQTREVNRSHNQARRGNAQPTPRAQQHKSGQAKMPKITGTHVTSQGELSPEQKAKKKHFWAKKKNKQI
jgi:ATP-dependent RNA helicase RhlE